MTDTETRDYYAEGYDAFLAGCTDADNPYEIGSDAAMSWEDGRSAAEDDA